MRGGKNSTQEKNILLIKFFLSKTQTKEKTSRRRKNILPIKTGFLPSKFQIAVSPTLYTTTPAAKLRFSARERGCYSDREVMLKHLPYGMYRSGLVLSPEWGLSQNISSHRQSSKFKQKKFNGMIPLKRLRPPIGNF